VRVCYARQSQATGYAYYNGGSMTIRLPHPYPSPRRWWGARRHPDGTVTSGAQVTPQPPRVDGDGVALPDVFARIAWVIEHEALHTLNWTHQRMRQEQHPAYKCRDPNPPPWAVGVVLRVAPAARAKPALAPEARAEARAAMVRDRAEKDIEALARWQRKLKLANTKVKGLLRKIAARERRTTAREP
jgi:hypothetical protein